MLVVPGEGEPWERVVDLRVEEGDGSLVELRRLLTRASAIAPRIGRRTERAELGERYGLPARHVQQLAIQDALAPATSPEAKRLYAALDRGAASLARRDPRASRRSRISRASRHSSTTRIERMPKALYFTDDPAACELLGSDPFAMLIGFAIDQQVTRAEGVRRAVGA